MQIAADKAERRPATYEELAGLINNSDEWAAGALVKLFQLQTTDEQDSNGTSHLNNYGFNNFDAPVLSDIAKFYLNKGYLSPRQLIFIKRTVKKYVNQLLSVGCTPVSLKPFSPIAKPQQPKMASLLVQQDTRKPTGIKIEFPFDRDTIEKVKTLPDRRWMADQKYWKAGLSLEAGKQLKAWGFEFSEGLDKWFTDLTKPVDQTALDFASLDSRLRPFQREGVAFIESRKGRALIGDDMGLGKTCQALSWLRLHPELRPVVIVVPASLKLNWKREVKMWIGAEEKVQIISGRKNGCALTGKIIIINYDILESWLEALIAHQPKVLIYDECHYMRNSKTIRTKAAKKLAKSCNHVICLSGTPIVNRPMEFFNPINMIRPDVFPSFWNFAKEFCGARNNGFGWDFTGATNTDKLHKLLTETIMIRRKKADVLKDLPPKIHTILPFEISNRKEYNRAAEDIIAWIFENEGQEKAHKASQAEVLVEFEKLKQLAVQGKMAAAVEWITDFLESGEKLVVFATHTKTLDLLQEEFKAISVRLDGSTSQKDRQAAVDRFQTDDSVRLFLGNTKAAGVGITLTAASNVIHMELPWTPGDLEQASDRCHRIGQHDAVNIWIPVALNTIEEPIAAILSEKQKVLAAVLDGEKVEEGSVLSDLIKAIKEK